jgi:hypothetical protein
MSRTVIKPRVQIAFLVAVFTVWALLGATYFTPGDALAQRDWVGIALGCLAVAGGVVGIWRALRLGLTIDKDGVHVRSFDSRDQITAWTAIQAIDCVQIDVRAGMPLYAPVLRLDDHADPMPLPALGSYSRRDVERRVEHLRTLKTAASDR